MKRAITEKVVRAPSRGNSRSAGPNKLPFYKSIGNSRKVAYSVDVGDYMHHISCGRVVLDFNDKRQLIGVEIIG